VIFLQPHSLGSGTGDHVREFPIYALEIHDCGRKRQVRNQSNLGNHFPDAAGAMEEAATFVPGRAKPGFFVK